MCDLEEPFLRCAGELLEAIPREIRDAVAFVEAGQQIQDVFSVAIELFGEAIKNTVLERGERG